METIIKSLKGVNENGGRKPQGRIAELRDNKLRITDVGRFYVVRISEVFCNKRQKDIEHPLFWKHQMPEAANL